MVQEIREECKRTREDQLFAAFLVHDKDKNGTLSTGEIIGVLTELGITPKCREEQDELKQLLQDIDLDSSGDVNFEEFQNLFQHASERIRLLQRHGEETTA